MTGHGHPEPYHHTLPPHLRKPITTAHTTASIAALNNTPPLTPLPATKTSNTAQSSKAQGPNPASGFAKKAKARMGKGPGKRASSTFISRVQKTVVEDVTGCDKEDYEEDEEDPQETEAAHHCTDALLTAHSHTHVPRVISPKAPAQQGLSTIPETTTINGALGTSTGLPPPHRVYEGEEYEAYTKPELPEMVVEYPGPYSQPVPQSEMPTPYTLGQTVLDHVDLDELKRKQTEFASAVIHNVKAYLRTSDESLLGDGSNRKVDREGREEDDLDDQGAWGGMSEEYRDLRNVRRQRSDRELLSKE